VGTRRNTKIELSGFYNHTENDNGIAFFILPGTVTTTVRRLPQLSKRHPAQSLFEAQSVQCLVKADSGSRARTFTSLTSYSHAEQPLRFTQSGFPARPFLGRSAVELNLFGRSSTFSRNSS